MKTEELVMLHYDGELEPARAREVEKLLAGDPRARQLLEQFERVGSLLREADAARPPPLDLTRQILKRVFVSPRVLSTSVESRAKARPGAAAAWVGAGLGVAAAVALLLGRPYSPESSGSSSRAPASDTAPPAAAVRPLDSEPPESAVALESVDFGTNQGAIFLVPTSESPMLVVWTLDDETDMGREIDL